MLSTLTIQLKGEENQRYSFSLASLFHGVIMEKIDSNYADYLHLNQRHPYSQYVICKQNIIYWVINTIDKQAKYKIIDVLLNDDFKEIFLKTRNETLKIIKKDLKEYSYDQLIEQYYFGSHNRFINIDILTPMSFKKDGKYVIFPTTRLLLQSLMLRFDAYAKETSIYSCELLDEFERYAEISDYRLRSVRFYLEGVKIPSFIGRISIHVNGPQQFVNIVWMLLKFGEYSGAGIKTSLGMGALHIQDTNIKRK